MLKCLTHLAQLDLDTIAEAFFALIIGGLRIVSYDTA